MRCATLGDIQDDGSLRSSDEGREIPEAGRGMARASFFVQFPIRKTGETLEGKHGDG